MHDLTRLQDNLITGKTSIMVQALVLSAIEVRLWFLQTVLLWERWQRLSSPDFSPHPSPFAKEIRPITSLVISWLKGEFVIVEFIYT